jgi:microcin C transport system substrate-binding protein
MTGTFDSLNPYALRGKTHPYLFALSHISLLARNWDEPFSLYPGLASGIRMAADRSTIEFTLDPDAIWSDGMPVTAADVLFSHRILRDQGRPGHRSYYSRVAAVTRTGQRSVRFDLAPNADGSIDRELPLIIGLMPILPEHWWSGRDITRTTLEVPPVAGPYQVAVAEPGRRLVFERRRPWWGDDVPAFRGLFNVDRVVIDYYRDETVALQAFKAGQTDVRVETDPALWTRGYGDGDGAPSNQPRIVREEIAHGRTEWTRAIFLNARRPPLDDARVREALGLALDYDWMNKALFHGALRPVESLYPNSDLGASAGPPGPAELALLAPFRTLVDPRTFGPAWRAPRTDASGPAGQRPHLRRAMALLAAAGFRVVDGRQVGPDGRPLSLELLIQNAGEEKLALTWARSLDRIGVTVRTRLVDSAQFRARIDRFEADAVIHRWVSTLSPGNEQSLYYGSAAADQPGSRNWPGIRSPAIDAVIAAMGQARTRDELRAATAALDRLVLWGHWIVPLFHSPVDRVARWSHLKRPDHTPLYGIWIDAWWVDGGDRDAGVSGGGGSGGVNAR